MQKTTDVYPETMEVTENKDREPKEIRNARLAGIQKRKHSKRIFEQWYSTNYYTNKRLAYRGYYDISEAYKSLYSL